MATSTQYLHCADRLELQTAETTLWLLRDAVLALQVPTTAESERHRIADQLRDVLLRVRSVREGLT